MSVAGHVFESAVSSRFPRYILHLSRLLNSLMRYRHHYWGDTIWRRRKITSVTLTRFRTSSGWTDCRRFIWNPKHDISLQLLIQLTNNIYLSFFLCQIKVDLDKTHVFAEKLYSIEWSQDRDVVVNNESVRISLFFCIIQLKLSGSQNWSKWHDSQNIKENENDIFAKKSVSQMTMEEKTLLTRSVGRRQIRLWPKFLS